MHPYFEYRTPEDAAREANCPADRPPRDGEQEDDAQKRKATPGESEEQQPGQRSPAAESPAASQRSRDYVLTSVPWVSPEGKRISIHTDRPEALDALYTLKANQTRLDFRTGPEKHVKKVPLISAFRPKGKPKDLEPLTSILLCIDDSESMMSGSGPTIAPDVPWGESSFYHHALLAVYSVAKWLQSEKKPYQVNVVTFSSSTRATGWCPASKLREQLCKTVFQPESAGTTLKPNVLEEHLPPTQGCLVIVFSDGEISNATQLIELFTRPEISERSLLVLIHTLRPTNWSGQSMLGSAMREHGFMVHDVKDPGDIPGYIVGTNLFGGSPNAL